jgi:hypothetical protein
MFRMIWAVATGITLAAILAPPASAAAENRAALPAAYQIADRCHPTQHGACWFWTCCL